MQGEVRTGRGELPTVASSWEIGGIGDFDADGFDDIFWHNPTTGNNAIWLLDGVSRKTRASIQATGAGWRPFGVYDMNGDGMADILWRHGETGSNRLWMMNGPSRTASLPVRTVTDPNWEPVAVGNVSN